MIALAAAVIVCAVLAHRWLMAREGRLNQAVKVNEAIADFEKRLEAQKEATAELAGAMAGLTNQVSAVAMKHGVMRKPL